MTVQELIKELKKIEDKDKEVYYLDGGMQVYVFKIEEQDEDIQIM